MRQHAAVHRICDRQMRVWLCFQINHYVKTTYMATRNQRNIVRARNNGMETISSKLFHIVGFEINTNELSECVLCRTRVARVTQERTYFLLLLPVRRSKFNVYT